MRSRKSIDWKINILSNLVLGIVLISVCAFSLFSKNDFMETSANEAEIYRNGKEENGGVSLMFNVYWGTDEVYQILDILSTHNAKATFFIGGSWADDNVECLRSIKKKGHEIGNHGYFHKDHSKLSIKDNEKEISACNQFIQLSIGENPTLFAPPSGAYGNDMISACKTLGMKIVLWSRDTIDWRDKDENLIYKRATKDIKSGEFVLMHPMKDTCKALDRILSYYETQSLKAITVSDNLQSKNNKS